MFHVRSQSVQDEGESVMFTKAANRNQIGEVWRICLLESMVMEVWSYCHRSNLGGHRSLEGTLNKFL